LVISTHEDMSHLSNSKCQQHNKRYAEYMEYHIKPLFVRIMLKHSYNIAPNG